MYTMLLKRTSDSNITAQMGYVRSIQLASGQGIGKGAAVQPQWKGFTKGGPKGPSKGVATVSVVPWLIVAEVSSYGF